MDVANIYQEIEVHVVPCPKMDARLVLTVEQAERARKENMTVDEVEGALSVLWPTWRLEGTEALQADYVEDASDIRDRKGDDAYESWKEGD